MITDLFGRILKADRSKFSNDFLKELLFYLEDHFDNLDAARGFLQFLGQRVAVRMDFKILDLLDFKVEDYILEIFNFMKTLDNKDLVDNYIKDLHDLLEDVHNKYKEKLDFTNPDMDDKTRMKRLRGTFPRLLF